MSNEVVTVNSIEKLLIQGDLSGLSSEQKVLYYNQVCESLGLNKLTKPFSYIKLNGKEVLYASRDCTDQLRKLHQVSIEISSREKIGDVYIVTARAKNKDGRVDESTGVVAIGNAKGDILANLFMKAETKAKRRVTLSICGLGMLDETEIDSIPGAKNTKDVAPEMPYQAVKKALENPSVAQDESLTVEEAVKKTPNNDAQRHDAPMEPAWKVMPSDLAIVQSLSVEAKLPMNFVHDTIYNEFKKELVDLNHAEFKKTCAWLTGKVHEAKKGKNGK